MVSGQASVGQVEGGWEHVELEDVKGDEEDEEWMLIEDDRKEESTEGGKPPEVSDEELEKLGEEAARKEVEKLKGMGVIAEITRNESPQGAKWLTLKNIYDWRFRSPGNGEPERWLRRCRIMRREFRTTTGSSAETFAPTSGLAAIKLFFIVSYDFCYGPWIAQMRSCKYHNKNHALWKFQLGLENFLDTPRR